MKGEKTRGPKQFNRVQTPNGLVDGLPRFDVADAVPSGALNEKQLIPVLTEMCRCILTAEREQSESAQPVDAPPAVV